MSTMKRKIVLGVVALAAAAGLVAMPAPSHADSAWNYRCASYGDSCGERQPTRGR